MGQLSLLGVGPSGSGSGGAPAGLHLLTEGGDFLVTESGDQIVTG